MFMRLSRVADDIRLVPMTHISNETSRPPCLLPTLPSAFARKGSPVPDRHGEKKRPMEEAGHERHSVLTCQAEYEWVVTQAGELLCRTENEAFIHLWSMDMDVQ